MFNYHSWQWYHSSTASAPGAVRYDNRQMECRILIMRVTRVIIASYGPVRPRISSLTQYGIRSGVLSVDNNNNNNNNDDDD